MARCSDAGTPAAVAKVEVSWLFVLGFDSANGVGEVPPAAVADNPFVHIIGYDILAGMPFVFRSSCCHSD